MPSILDAYYNNGGQKTLNTSMKLPTFTSKGTPSAETNGTGMESFLKDKMPGMLGGATSALGGIQSMFSAAGNENKDIAAMGMADAGVDAVAGVASMFGPVGSAIGMGLKAVNGIGGSLMGTPKSIKDFSVNTDIGSGYGGVTSAANSAKAGADAFGNAGLAGKLAGGSGLKKKIDLANNKMTRAAFASNQANLSKNAATNSIGMFDAASNNRLNKSMYNDPNNNITVGKKGMLLKFQNGGKLKNIIVTGALHARKNNIKDIEEFKDANVTEKGIAVISKEKGGEIVQHAEIENQELILHIELTKELNELFKEYNESESQEDKDEILIEAGKLLSKELLGNTIDKTKLIKSTE